MKAQKAVIKNKYSPAWSSKVGSCNVQFPLPPLQHRHDLLLLRRQRQRQQLRSPGKGTRRHTTRVTIWTVRSNTLRNLERQIRSHNGRSQILDGRNQTEVTPTNFGRSGSHQGKQRELLLKKIHKLGILQSKIIKFFFGFGFWFFF